MSSSINPVKVYDPIYYHREYKNDVAQEPKEESENTWVNICQRIGFAALPFFSLYKPLSFPLSLGMGGLRTYTSVTQLFESIKSGDTKNIPFEMMQVSISVIALAGTVFAHPLGMLISTGNDLVIEVCHLVHNLQVGEYKKAAENCLGIINNALYLSLFLHGGLELSIASLATQILIGLYHSQAEFRNGHYIEGAGHLLMSMTRGTQLSGQVKTLHLRNTFHKSLQTCLNETNTSSVKKSQLINSIKSKFYETYNVSVINYGGYNFHVAIYPDSTRVITCLDGEMRGYQGVAINGAQIAESFDVQWYNDHFVHRYPNGKIYSYSNKQIAELH
jgi:hypothetical protein